MPVTLKCQRVKYAVHRKTRSPHLTNCFVVLLLDCFFYACFWGAPSLFTRYVFVECLVLLYLL